MRAKHGTITVRRATVEDAPAIATVHVAAWQWAYSGLFPGETLASLDTARRTTLWRDALAAGSGDVWVATNPHVVGFASVAHDAGSDELTGYDELTAIYLLRSAQGVGVGKALMGDVLVDMRDRHVAGAFLWVADGNVLAKRFYEGAGWRPDDARREMDLPGGHSVDIVRYVIEL